MAIDDTPLEVFADLARDLTVQSSKQAVLDRVVELAVQHLDGCDDAGVLLLYRKRGVETAAATSRRIHDSDQAQGRLRQGPCFDAAMQVGAWHNGVYRSDDLATETRWPSYIPQARALGVGSMMGFQLYRDEEFFAALDLYSNQRHALDERAEQMGWVFASYAAMILISARTGGLPGITPPAGG
ncbi:GAF domain-containing protein [Haloactinomyces albus]|uniref:GAF domain-containing protein n=1 Tax=Haloactinomyces albus TaxID=1352928 RepID=A0AAE4CNF7_9ACTN|nr:GAF domain-containing protein [Haloactinomyces albus]MDR7300613.1 GAF domain-containing protein [Haloactinomyces albus]